MTRIKARYRLDIIELTGREIIIVAILFVLVGGFVLTAAWIHSGAMFAPTSVNVIQTAGGVQPAGIISHISVRDVTSSAATLTWTSTDANAGPTRIQYGIREDQLVYSKDVSAQVVEMTLEDLSPRTKYFFRIIINVPDGPIISDTYSFITTN